MTNLRDALAGVLFVLLGIGYAASQWAAHQGFAPEYAARVDVPGVQWLALGLFAAIVAGIAWPRHEDEPR